MNIEYNIKRIDECIATLQKQRDAFVKLGERLAGIKTPVHFSIAGDMIDIDLPKRGEVVDIIKHLKTGKWRKQISCSAPDKVDYYNDTFFLGVKIRMYQAEPPASCKIVMEDVVIPAQPERIEKRPKLVCKEH